MKKLTFIFVLVLLISGSAAAQGNAFNFQGRLNDGTTPANGSYDLNFRLYDAITGGNPINSLVARPNTTLINGVFSVALDFGATAFNNPASIFIEIGIRPNGSTNAYTILGPRQQLTVVPFAVRAMNSTFSDLATNAANAANAQNSLNSQNAVLATNATNAANAANSDKLNNLNSTDFIRNSTTAQPTSNFNISGSGVVGGNLNVAGNVQQNRDKGGTVKAMIYVFQSGSILRCYNGITGASTGNCGFSINKYGAGRYEINFGFQVSDRFVAVTATQSTLNRGANFFFSSSNTVNVFTFYSDEFEDKDDNDFMIIIF